MILSAQVPCRAGRNESGSGEHEAVWVKRFGRPASRCGNGADEDEERASGEAS